MSDGPGDSDRAERAEKARLLADAMGIARDANAEGRRALAAAVAKDDAMRAAGDIVWTLAKGALASYTGPMGPTVADAARLIVEDAITRRTRA